MELKQNRGPYWNKQACVIRALIRTGTLVKKKKKIIQRGTLLDRGAYWKEVPIFPRRVEPKKL